MAHSHCTGPGPGPGQGPGQGPGNVFLYYTMSCTHYTGTGTGNHCFLLYPSRSLSRSRCLSRAVCISHEPWNMARINQRRWSHLHKIHTAYNMILQYIMLSLSIHTIYNLQTFQLYFMRVLSAHLLHRLHASYLPTLWGKLGWRSVLAHFPHLTWNSVLTHSVRFTTAPGVGSSFTMDLNGVPWNPRSRIGTSNSTSFFVRFSTFSQKLLNADFSLWRISLSAWNQDIKPVLKLRSDSSVPAKIIVLDSHLTETLTIVEKNKFQLGI